MTNEEIDAEIARLTALKEQNNQVQSTENNKPADGVYNPADYISKIARALDDQSLDYDRGRGNKFSSNLEVAKGAGRRTGFEKDTDGTPLPETAYEWILQQIHVARSRGPVNKHTLDAIENGAKVRYNLPVDFDISGKGFLSGNTHRNLVKAMNSIPYNGKPQEPSQPPKAQEQQPTKPKGKQVANSNKGVAGASVGDFIVRSDGSTHVLTQGDINWAKKKTERQTQQVDENTVRGTENQLKADIKNGNVKPTYNENSIIGATQEELDFMKSHGLSEDLYNKGMQAIKNGNGLSDDDTAFMDKYNQYTQLLSGAQPTGAAASEVIQSSDVYKFIADPANTERYKKLSQVQKDANKVNKMKQSIAAAKEDNTIYGDVGTFGE